MHLNYLRMYWFNEPLLSIVVYRKLLKNFNSDFLSEYDKIFKIDMIFNDFNYENKIKYYF